MKNLISMFVVICIAGSALFAQSALKMVKERVGNPDILKNWKVGEAKQLSNAMVLRAEGANDIDDRTNLFYTANGSYLPDAPGGQISLFYDRNDEKLANPALFTVTVLDAEGNEIFQQCLAEGNQPYYYKWDIWYYYETINIPVLVSRSFTVLVEDNGLNKNFKFQVTIHQDSQFMQQELLSLSADHLPY